MKAMVFDKTGETREVPTIRNLPGPARGPREALVRMPLSPVHLSDLHMVPLSLRSVRARVLRPILSLAGWCCLRERRGEYRRDASSPLCMESPNRNCHGAVRTTTDPQPVAKGYSDCALSVALPGASPYGHQKTIHELAKRHGYGLNHIHPTRANFSPCS